MDTDYYILRFGLYTVQLWRLIEMGPNASETDKSQEGFQLEGSPYFYKSMYVNKLVYIRAYKATDYGAESTFKDHWRIRTRTSVYTIKPVPEVLFMDDTGHIFVEIKKKKINYLENLITQPSNHNSRDFLRFFKRKWPFSIIIKKAQSLVYNIVDVDEIFLPISKTFTISMDNRFSAIDSTGNSTHSDFHEIESACRALHYINDTNEVRYLCREEVKLLFIQ